MALYLLPDVYVRPEGVTGMSAAAILIGWAAATLAAGALAFVRRDSA